MRATRTSMRRTRLIVQAGVLVCLLFALLPFQADEKKPSRSPAEAPTTDVPITLASILDSIPNPDDYSEQRQCISRPAVEDYEILGKRHIVLRLRGKDRPKILIEFKRPCHGLHRNAILAFQSRGTSRVCSGDSIRSEVVEFGRRNWGPRCSIPSLEPITEYQIDLLKDALYTGRVE